MNDLCSPPLGTEHTAGNYVGWVERDGRRWFFALNVDMAKVSDAPKRVTLAKQLLGQLGALPASETL